MNLIIKPIISEKSMKNAEKGKFTFEVSKSARKEEIKKEVEEKFKVHVLNVKTTIVKGRSITSGIRRISKKLSAFKKAVVELKKGEKIDLFEVGVSA